MFSRVKSLAIVTMCLWLLALCFTAQAQTSPPPQPAPPASSQGNGSRHQRLPKQPFFVTFDVSKKEFFVHQGIYGKDQIVSKGFFVEPDDMVYFRAVNFRPDQLKVTGTYQPVPPNSTALPTPFTSLLASVSTGAAANTSSNNSSTTDSQSETTESSNANRLLDLLANAVKSYSYAPPTSTDLSAINATIGTAIANVQNKAEENLRTYMLSDSTAKKIVANILNKKLSELDPHSLDNYPLLVDGVHLIILVAEGKRKAAGKDGEKVYNRYMGAADLWRNIAYGTFFDTAVGPEVADDTVGQMVWKVEVSDATTANPPVAPYTLTIQKRDKRNVEFAVSANIVGSLLRDDSYYADAKGIIQRQSRNDFNVTTGAFLHVIVPRIFSSSGAIRPALSFGITPENSPKYMVGASLIAGHDQRIVLTAGVISGSVVRLANGLRLGVDAAPATGNIPTQSVTRSAFFFSIGFKF
jgi:hypothetical protein